MDFCSHRDTHAFVCFPRRATYSCWYSASIEPAALLLPWEPRQPGYFCRSNLWRISGQNSLMMLLRLAASSCATQFIAVLCKLRSSGG